jgi:hypothetical protein
MLKLASQLSGMMGLDPSLASCFKKALESTMMKTFDH